MLFKGGFLVCSQAQLRNVSEAHIDTFVIILHGMQLHLISTNPGFLDFFILDGCLFDQAVIKETQAPPGAGMAKGPSQRARCSSLEEWFFHMPHFCGFGLLTVLIVFPSFSASPVFMLKLKFVLFSRRPPFFIASNYLWYFWLW